MQSKATSVKEYLSLIPAERRPAVKAVRDIIKKNLPPGYAETMRYGMISYVVPLSLYPEGYLGNKEAPLPYICLASQKNYIVVYLMNIYQDKKTENWFHSEYEKSGKKMDMGKSCIRFKKVEDLPLDLIGKAAALTQVEKFIEMYEKSRKVLR